MLQADQTPSGPAELQAFCDMVVSIKMIKI
jgi:hypothetical protein